MKKKIIILVTCICVIFAFTACGGSSDTSTEEGYSDSYYTEADTSNSVEQAVPLALYAFLNSCGWSSSYDIGSTTYSTTIMREQAKGDYNYYAEGYCTLYKKDGSDSIIREFTMDIDTVHRNAYVKLEHLGGSSVGF